MVLAQGNEVNGKAFRILRIVALLFLRELSILSALEATVIHFLQQLLQGLKLGGIYALIALGYTMVYGILRLINFAHGDVFMLGAMAGIYVAKWTGLDAHPSWTSFFVVLLFSMGVCALIGAAIERLAYRPLRHAPRLSLLITAIGVSLFIEYFCQLDKPFTPGPTPKLFPELLVTQRWLDWKGLTLTNIEALVFLVSIALMILLHTIIHHTRLGLAMRAVSHDFQTAALMGINVNAIIGFTFILGSALAGAAGVLFGMTYPSIDPLIGIPYGIKAFVAAVLGGIGNIPGALLGGFLIAEAETFTATYISSTYKDAVAFLILIVVLLFKPSGLLGGKTQDKV